MTAVAIEAHALCKRYDLGEKSLLRGFRGAARRQEFLALREVSFTIREHEAVGIIGSNGAGKSTLLKILSRVTAPTGGRARIRGRIGTILEVGTGFHPELTGRENVYLSGTILGMQKKEVERKFEEIVDFAGVDQFVDTPVKRYSSGMYVRLAFAVAAHLDPDILIVDEVLAVGDTAFQKKCLAKMDSSIHQDGRTIIFVSHNMQAIRSLCSRALLLREGQLMADGPVGEVIALYNSREQATLEVRDLSLRNRLNRTRGNARMTKLSMSNPLVPNSSGWQFMSGDALEMTVGYEVLAPIESLEFTVSFTPVGSDAIISNIKEKISASPLPPGHRGTIKLTIPNLPFRPGELSLVLGMGSSDFAFFEDILDANVNLPYLVIESMEEDLYLRKGFVSLGYHVKNQATGTSEPSTLLHMESR